MEILRRQQTFIKMRLYSCNEKLQMGTLLQCIVWAKLIFRLSRPMYREHWIGLKSQQEMGYPQAQATVGALYLKGLPGLLEKDEKEGIQLLSKAVLSKSLLRLDTILVWHIIMAMECSKIWKRQYSGCELQKNKIF